MLHRKQLIKKTKPRQQALGSTAQQEHYLRDDLPCGLSQCSICSSLPGANTLNPTVTVSPSMLVSEPHIIIPSAEVLAQQLDVLMSMKGCNIVISQTAMEFLKERQSYAYHRLRKWLAEGSRSWYVIANEHHREMFVEKRGDEQRVQIAINRVVDWYCQHLEPQSIRVVFLVSDEKNHSCSLTVKEYVESLSSQPELTDMMFHEDDKVTEIEYDNHLPLNELLSGIKSGKYLQGVLSVSTYNLFEGTIMADLGEGGQSVAIINRKNMNRALQGDTVAVELLPRGQWVSSVDNKIIEDEDEEDEEETSVKTSPSSSIPTGKVVGIVKRQWRQYCGSVKDNSLEHGGAHYVLVEPLDRRIPRIRIRTRQSLKGQRILVAIDTWERQSRYPQGHFVKKLGATGDKETETEALLIEHDVPFESFTRAVIECLPAQGDTWNVNEHAIDLEKRKDLRNLLVCSIDPPGCTDIDDALHCRSLPNGNVEVGVHIADVTYFCKPHTAMDIEASQRSTTVYLVDKRIDMLPGLLGTNLCSLHCNVDRLAFSCIWEMTMDGDIVSTEYVKSVIRSCSSFTYEQAQARIDDPHATDELTMSIRALNSIAKKLKTKRIEAGALTLASPELRFKLENDSQDPVDVEMKQLKETNSLVEEFMLLANISVAKKIHSMFPDCSLLRRHPTPPQHNFDALRHALVARGFTLDSHSSKALADSLNHINNPQDSYFNNLVRIMTTRCMMQAVYFCSGTSPDFAHYGLACDIYTHFTSPIRRYADVMVHRLLNSCIQYESISKELLDKTKMNEQAEILNHRHRMAQMASRASAELFTLLFFKDKMNTVEDAYVIKLVKNGIVALVPKYGIESVVRLSGTLDTENWTFSTGGAVYSLFEKINVSLRVDVEQARRKLVMELVDRKRKSPEL